LGGAVSRARFVCGALAVVSAVMCGTMPSSARSFSLSVA